MNTITSIILGGSGLISTIVFSCATIKRESDKILKNLFTEFNSRYNNLNNELLRIVKPDTNKEKIKPEDRAIIIDFFNLCAEEYLWKRKRRIDSKIWRSWQAGMNYWYNHNNPIIRELWDEETHDKNGLISYYIEKKDEFFKLKNK